MKVKTINKIIKDKMEEWTLSIKDEKLRKKVRANIVVSGGCIASMFQQEPVNDYDVYLKDMDVLIALAEYYAPNKVMDGRKRDEYLAEMANGRNIDEDQTMLMVRYKTLTKDRVKLDIDSWGKRFVPKMNPKTKQPIPYQVAFLSQNAISLTDDLQIVLRFNGTVENIHKTFDFMHATNYWTYEHGLVTNLVALECLLTKELKYQGSLYPLTSIIRMKKFILRGWSITAGEILKIMYQISELDLNNVEVLEDQLIGVDIAYFGMLIQEIRGMDSPQYNSEELNKMIDKAFGEAEGEEFKEE